MLAVWMIHSQAEKMYSATQMGSSCSRELENTLYLFSRPVMSCWTETPNFRPEHTPSNAANTVVYNSRLEDLSIVHEIA